MEIINLLHLSSRGDFCAVVEKEYLVQGIFKCLQGGEAVLGL